jgi:putative salt-induced outer membrane protein YdiY
MLLDKTVRKIVLIWAGILLGPLAVQAQTSEPTQDELVLKNGSRLIGTVTSSRDGQVTFETDFAGTLIIAMDQIESMRAQNPVVVLLADESVVRDSSLNISQESLVLPSAAEPYPLENLSVLNPEPWELGQGYRWTGGVSFALAMQRGNTDTDELDYKFGSVWRSKRDRYTLNWGGEQDEANGEKNADNWQLMGKYDYFLAGPNYVGLLASAEKDKFKDLDLRYQVGPYFGRQFYEEPVFSLSGELGLSYVNEQYNIAEDQDYGAGNWNLHITSDYLGGDSLLYFNQNGIWSLEDMSDVIVNSTFGLSFPLLWNLEAAAEVLLEYDSGAVENVDDMDETYKFRVGYSW